jgi:hypothetical protein
VIPKEFLLNLNDPVFILLAAFIILIIPMVIVLVLQAKQEKNISNMNTLEMLKSSKIQLNNKNMSIFHIKPQKSDLYMNYSVLDENSNEALSINCVNRYKTLLSTLDFNINAYIQESGLLKTVYSGKVGGNSNKSVILALDGKVIIEIKRKLSFPNVEYSFVFEKKEYIFRISLFSMRSIRQLICLSDNSIVGEANLIDSGGLGRDYCVAANNDQSNIIKYCPFYLTILNN